MNGVAGQDDVRLAAGLRSGWRHAQVAMARGLAESGLSGPEYHLLLAVGAAGEAGIRQVDLAQELDVPEGRISVLARELSERGLIEAVRSDQDRRYVRLRLRPSGYRLLTKAMSSQREQLAALVARYPRETLVRMAEHIMRAYLGLDVEVSLARGG
jgi:DNA-binding MarR family transcriptional regulator